MRNTKAQPVANAEKDNYSYFEQLQDVEALSRIAKQEMAELRLLIGHVKTDKEKIPPAG